MNLISSLFDVNNTVVYIKLAQIIGLKQLNNKSSIFQVRKTISMELKLSPILL